MIKEMELLPEDQIKAKISKLEHKIKGIKEQQKKILNHQREIEQKKNKDK